MKETIRLDNNTFNAHETGDLHNIDIEKRISESLDNNSINFCKENTIDIDKRIDERYTPEISIKDRNRIYTTEKKRIEIAGRSYGDWTGEKGNSILRPRNENAQRALDYYGLDGIEYKSGNPDFSKCSEETARIENMCSERGINFRQADDICAKNWNSIKKGGKDDWTRYDVKEWRHDNHYSWHERIDKKTMDLVQRDIHMECKHLGGVAECREMEEYCGGKNEKTN